MIRWLWFGCAAKLNFGQKEVKVQKETITAKKTLEACWEQNMWIKVVNKSCYGRLWQNIVTKNVLLNPNMWTKVVNKTWEQKIGMKAVDENLWTNIVKKSSGEKFRGGVKIENRENLGQCPN